MKPLFSDNYTYLSSKKSLTVQRSTSGILVTRMTWDRDLPSREPIYLLLHSFFVPCFSYPHFTVYLPSLFCFLQIPSSAHGSWTLTLLTQTHRKCHDWDTTTAVPCFCLSFIMLHLTSVLCIWTAHSSGLDVASYLLVQYEATWGFNPHWFWPY